jgi:hypothetical protein
VVGRALAQLRFIAQREVLTQKNFTVDINQLKDNVLTQLQQEAESTVRDQLPFIFDQLAPIVSDQVQHWSAELVQQLGIDPRFIVPIANGVSNPNPIDLGGVAGIEFLMPAVLPPNNRGAHAIRDKNDASLQ